MEGGGDSPSQMDPSSSLRSAGDGQTGGLISSFASMTGGNAGRETPEERSSAGVGESGEGRGARGVEWLKPLTKALRSADCGRSIAKGFMKMKHRCGLNAVD
jgi:hypothetical protein